MTKTEFFSPEGKVCVQPSEGVMFELSPKHRELIQAILSGINNQCIGTYERLELRYADSVLNKPYHEYQMACRFCKCNFGNYDTLSWDVDEQGRWHFEKVSCPLRGECPDEGVICLPKIRSDLSKRETEIAELLSRLSPEEIAERFGLSIRTVYNHIQAIKVRLRLKTIAQIATWYKTNYQL